MRSLMTFAQILLGAVAAWLFIGLLGSIRWLSPVANPGPEALLAAVIKLLALAVFIAIWVAVARRSESSRPQRRGYPLG